MHCARFLSNLQRTAARSLLLSSAGAVLVGAAWSQTQTQAEKKIARPLPRMIGDKSEAEAQPTTGSLPIDGPEAQRLRRFARTPAQDTPSLKAPPPHSAAFIDRSHVFVDEPGDGRIWARGANYKASFGDGGATFIPFLGSNAPRNFPVRFTLASVEVGGENLAFDAQGAVTRAGERVVIMHGSLSEVYDLGTDGIEQTFVFESLPRRGRVTVRLAIESELASRSTPNGVEFASELGGVRYGHTTVLDADGARVDVPSRLDNGQLALEVPADFVERARLPLRVDPGIVGFAINTSAADDYAPDIAYDASTDHWCCAYEEAFSTTDHDIVTVVIDQTGLVLSPYTTYIDFTSQDWAVPKIANNYLASNFLTVAMARTNITSPYEIRGRTRPAASVIMGAQFLISGAETGQKVFPDVGGDPSPYPPTYYSVVWQRDYASNDTDIHGRMVNSDGTLYGPGTILIDDTSLTRDAAPRISKTDGNAPSSTQEWNVVWVRVNQAPAGNDVHAAQLHWDGGITSPSFVITSTTDEDNSPVASSPLDGPTGLRPWMVVFERSNGGQVDLWSHVMLGSSTQRSDDLSQLDGVNVNYDQFGPGVDSDGSQFIVVYAEPFNGTTADYDTYVSDYWYADFNLGVSEAHSALDYSADRAYQPRIATKGTGGAFRHMCCVVEDSYTNPATGDVRGILYQAPFTALAESYCTGDTQASAGPCPCGNYGAYGHGCASSNNPSGAWLLPTGDAIVSQDTLSFQLFGPPQGTSCLFYQGTASLGSGVAFGDGIRCAGGTVLRIATRAAGLNGTFYPLPNETPVHTSGSVPSSTCARYYQVWYRNASTTFCTPSTFNLSNGVRITWLP